VVAQFSRLAPIIGEKGVTRLRQSRVLVAGLGGVGSFCAEALVRCGVGTIAVMDSDRSEPSNLNRQLFALHSTLGENKFDAIADCIDALVPKLNLILSCIENDIPVVASTGAGFKLDPSRVQAGSIWETINDPLANKMRKKLRQWGHGNADFTVVYSPEKRQSPPGETTIASIITVTGTFGLKLAAEVLALLLDLEN